MVFQWTLSSHITEIKCTKLKNLCDKLSGTSTSTLEDMSD